MYPRYFFPYFSIIYVSWYICIHIHTQTQYKLYEIVSIPTIVGQYTVTFSQPFSVKEGTLQSSTTTPYPLCHHSLKLVSRLRNIGMVVVVVVVVLPSTHLISHVPSPSQYYYYYYHCFFILSAAFFFFFFFCNKKLH